MCTVPSAWKTSGTLVAEESMSAMLPSLLPQNWMPMGQLATERPTKTLSQFQIWLTHERVEPVTFTLIHVHC